MPIPPDASQVPGQENRVRLGSGEVVTRAHALNLGAQFMGYKNHRDYRGHASGDKKYMGAWLRTEQGRRAVEKEKALAKEEGRRYRKEQLMTRLIAARNARPHPRANRAARAPFVDFMTRYDITGGDDWVSY